MPILALLLTQMADSAYAGSGFPDILAFLPIYALAGIVYSIRWIHPFRSLFTLEEDPTAILRHLLFTTSAAFILFLVPTLLVTPEISARWLVLFYAFSIVFEWLLLQALTRSIHPRPRRVATLLDHAPQAVFLLPGLVLLAVAFPARITAQQVAAERLANWAYGFLVLGTASTLLLFVPLPHRLKSSKVLPEVFLVLLVAASVVTGYAFGKAGLTTPQIKYITDLNSNYLSGRVRNGDVVISADPELNLGSLTRIFSSLDVRPDSRGLALWDDLNRSLADKRRVFWVGVPDKSNDTSGILSTYLKENGCLDDVTNAPLPVRLYEMQSPLMRPRVLPPPLVDRVANPFDPVGIDFNAIRVSGVRFDRQVCSHDAVAVAIRWQLDQPYPEPLKLSLALLDSKQREIQISDFDIKDSANQSTDRWTRNAKASGYYLLTVPFGTAPGDYSIALGVYPSSSSRRLGVHDASGLPTYSDRVALGQVHVYRPQDPSADPYQTVHDSGLIPARVELQDGLLLDAFTVSTQSLLPGSDLNITALWRATRAGLPAYSTGVQLVQGERVIAASYGSPADGAYPTDTWLAGESILDRTSLHVPPDEAGSSARLELGVKGGRSIYIADIDIAVVTHTFQIPVPGHTVGVTFDGVGELAGYDLDRGEVAQGKPVELTLYWRAGSSHIDKDYVIFAQLVAPGGHLVAQSDSIPSGGQRPTRGWLKDEIIKDRHELAFVEHGYSGDASLIVGMYNPLTMERVLVQGRSDGFVVLPTGIRVTGR